jgi:nicotinamidase-related amidase
MIDPALCCLVVVDVQGKLAQLMAGREALLKNIQILVRSAQHLGVPILWCQQVPQALGPTVPEIAELLTGIAPIDKSSFSCCGEPQFVERLHSLDRPQVLLCGIETHVCIYQTAVQLHAQEYHVTVIADAVSSRTVENKQIALNRLAFVGAAVASTEMVVFELLRTAQHPQFKEIAKLVK